MAKVFIVLLLAYVSACYCATMTPVNKLRWIFLRTSNVNSSINITIVLGTGKTTRRHEKNGPASVSAEV